MKNSNYISIRKYLESKGINPVNDRVYYGMYYSPLRDDINPSFKVDYQRNLWYDFGIGKGGSIVDLVMKLEMCSLADALKQLDNSFSFHRNDTSAISFIPTNREPAITVTKIKNLTHLALLNYLKKRGICIEIAKQYCSEVHYTIANHLYFGIGFQNDSKGWELRNISFKGSIAPKNVTTINYDKDAVIIFEGFIDYLSFLVLKERPAIESNVIVLNSVNNLDKAVGFLKQHKMIYTFLDNDESGRKCLNKIQELGITVSDQSEKYRDYKDLNDFLRSCSKSPKIEIKNGFQL